MSADAVVAPSPRIPNVPIATILAALEVERACLDSARRSSAAGVEIVQTGPGPAAARRGAEAAAARGSLLLLSFGLAGGLDSAAEPGGVCVPANVVTGDGTVHHADAEWQGRLRSVLGRELRLVEGDLLSTGRLLRHPREKEEASRRSGAAACDMESAAIAAVAASSGIPFAAVRIIADGAADALPGDVLRFVDAAGAPLLKPLFFSMSKPREWCALLVLARRYSAARKSMAAAASALFANGVLPGVRAGNP